MSSLHNGYAFQSSKYCNDGNYYVITIANVQDGEMVMTNDTNRVKVLPSDMQAHQKLKKGDLLISLTGNVGRICVVDRENCLLNQRVGLLSITHSELINTEFLFYCLQTRRFQIQMINAGKGGAQPNIGKMDVLDFSFDYPSYKEQCVIASSIRSINKHISTLKSLISKYKAIKKSTVNLLLEPKNDWKEILLGDIGDVLMCKRILKNQTTKIGDVPFYKIGTFGKIPDSFISRALFDDFKQRFAYPQKGDVLLSAAGTIGRTVVFNGEDAYFQDSNIVWIDNDESLVINSFLYVLYSQMDWQTENGGTVSRLYNSNIRNTRVTIPSLKEQKRIVAILDSIDETIHNLKSQLVKTQNIKEGMMTYFFG